MLRTRTLYGSSEKTARLGSAEVRSGAEGRRGELIEATVLPPVGSALVSRDTEIVERDGWYQVITPSTSAGACAAWRSRVAIEPVTVDNLAEYYACFVRGWDISVPDAGTRIDDHRRALATGRFHFFLARVGGEPVGTAGLIAKRRCVYLVGGSVIASHQRRGVYRALLDERLALAATLGSLAVTQAREATSAPILEKLGFESLYTSYVYKWEPTCVRSSSPPS